MSGCNNGARGLLWGRGISARFQGATNTGPCATRETRRDSRGNDLVGITLDFLEGYMVEHDPTK